MGSSFTKPEMTTIVFALQVYPFSSNGKQKLAIELKSFSGTIPNPAPEITVYYNQADETLAND
jgi:hypothetical protein